MGEVYQYHVTMLVTNEQVDAIRYMFKENNWPCWIKVLSDENVAAVVQNNLTEVFPVMSEGQDGGIGESVFTEIKSEIFDVEEISNSSEKLNDLPSKVEPPSISDDEDTMDYDMMSTNEHETSDTESNKKPEVKEVPDAKNKPSSRKRPRDNIERDAKGKLKCPLCEVSCVTKTILKRHYKRRHKDIWLDFECKDCGKRFEKRDELWAHRRESNHDPPKDKTKMVKPDQLSPEELEQLGHLKCQVCSNYYPHRRSLRRHMYKIHRDVLPKWNCPICDAEYETRDELWKHQREKKHKTNIWALDSYQCDSCGKIYTRYDSFTEHKLTCQKTESEKLACRQYPCDICGLVFKSIIRVKSHKRGVHIVAPVVCHECGALCKNKRALLVHRRRHDMKNKKFACDDCGKSFFNSTLLAQHVRTHTKEKPFKCPMCNYTCAIKQNIHKHSQKVHKTQCKAVCVGETKDFVPFDSEESTTVRHKFGSLNVLNRDSQALLQAQSRELQDIHSQSSIQSDMGSTGTGNGENSTGIQEVIDYSVNTPSFSIGDLYKTNI